MFFTHLIRHLYNTSAGWRKDTVILQVNAPYKTSASMMEFYEAYEVPVIFTGPHSYAASPIELFFAHFKSGELNPGRLPTGKT